MQMTMPVSSVTALARRMLNALQPALALGLRLYVGSVFLQSGLVKIRSWDTTVALFTYEYQVPLLAPLAAAMLGTAVELVIPVLLALGAGARVAAAILFVFNAVAVMAYPEISEAGVMQHQYWGVLLLVLLVYGPGRWSLDCLIRRRHGI